MPRSWRSATHAGSWYTDDAARLQRDISSWLQAVPIERNPGVRAIIAPHAGYKYSGHVMAYAYRHIDVENVSKIFLLGPSHHVYSQHCLLTSVSAYSTPFGPLEIDRPIYNALKETQMFQQMSLRVDEAEHSLEMHLPYIAYFMRNKPVTLVPILVGAISLESEEHVGRLLAPYMRSSSNLFIISSDFCHWGSRFSYTPYTSEQGAIYDAIKWLDLKGIDTIIAGRPEEFHAYLHQYQNTICGRHPIAVLLQMVKASQLNVRTVLKKYDQSSKCTSPTDSSVSYAAIVLSVALDAET